jgi:hypothetical protein
MIRGKSTNNIYHAISITNHYLCIRAVGTYKGIVDDGEITCKNCLRKTKRSDKE